MNKLNSVKRSMALLLLLVFTMSYIEASSQDKKKKKGDTEQSQVIQEDYGKTVSLVTTGNDSSKDRAIKNALRSAIEQAFGTFVSANTTVVNDELVRDEIATISSGNIVGYEEINSGQKDDGQWSVTLKSVVSIGKLVSFAQSHGMSAELAGNNYLLNRNLAKLNKKNELNALLNLTSQIEHIFPLGLYDYTVDVSQPKPINDKYFVSVSVTAKPNSNIGAMWNIIDKTLESLSMSEVEKANYKELGMATYPFSNRDNKKFCLRNNIATYSPFPDPDVPIALIVKKYTELGKYGFEIYDNLGHTITPSIKGQKVGEHLPINYVGNVSLGSVPAPPIDDYILYLKSNINLKYVEPHTPYNRTYKIDIIYSEEMLSKLQQISVRPHKTELPVESLASHYYRSWLVKGYEILNRFDNGFGKPEEWKEAREYFIRYYQIFPNKDVKKIINYIDENIKKNGLK